MYHTGKEDEKSDGETIIFFFFLNKTKTKIHNDISDVILDAFHTFLILLLLSISKRREKKLLYYFL